MFTTLRDLELVTFALNERLNGQHVRAGAEEASMKDLATVILGQLFVLVVLMSLISADPVAGRARCASLNCSGNTAELELRYALHK